MTFDVENDDGEKLEVVADSRDVLVFEKTSSRNETFVKLLQDLNMQALYRLCHIAAKRQGLYDGKLAEFEKSYVLHFAREDAVDPTTGAASSTA